LNIAYYNNILEFKNNDSDICVFAQNKLTDDDIEKLKSYFKDDISAVVLSTNGYINSTYIDPRDLDAYYSNNDTIAVKTKDIAAAGGIDKNMTIRCADDLINRLIINKKNVKYAPNIIVQNYVKLCFLQ
jgi:hypothetical protein